MDPHDAPYMFNCISHPTDFIPANLWNQHIKMIRELSFVNPEYLGLQMRMDEMAYKNSIYY